MSTAIRRYRVLGRVQGVGFRWFVREEARTLDLVGWVRNEPNGDVLVEVGGGAAAVERLASLLRIGPPSSQVTAVVQEPATASALEELPAPFTVHR